MPALKRDEAEGPRARLTTSSSSSRCTSQVTPVTSATRRLTGCPEKERRSLKRSRKETIVVKTSAAIQVAVLFVCGSFFFPVVISALNKKFVSASVALSLSLHLWTE